MGGLRHQGGAALELTTQSNQQNIFSQRLLQLIGLGAIIEGPSCPRQWPNRTKSSLGYSSTCPFNLTTHVSPIDV